MKIGDLTDGERMELLSSITDSDLPIANRVWANFWKARYLEAVNEVRNANRGIMKKARRKRRRKESVGEFLEHHTGVDYKQWIDFVNTTVAKHSVAAVDAPQRTYIYAVYAELLDHVRHRIAVNHGDGSRGHGDFDMMIAGAKVMSLVLASWAVAVTEAKAFDSRREMEDRKKMLSDLKTWRRQFTDHILLQPQERGPWKDQEWENPYRTIKLRKEDELSNAHGDCLPGAAQVK